jgi:hypothetical protein
MNVDRSSLNCLQGSCHCVFCCTMQDDHLKRRTKLYFTQHITRITDHKICWACPPIVVNNSEQALLFYVAFIVSNVSFIVCVASCAVLCLSVVWYFVLCLIAVPLPLGKNQFTVQLNNNNMHQTSSCDLWQNIQKFYISVLNESPCRSFNLYGTCHCQLQCCCWL